MYHVDSCFFVVKIHFKAFLLIDRMMMTSERINTIDDELSYRIEEDEGVDSDDDDDDPPMLVNLGENQEKPNNPIQTNKLKKKVPVTILTGFLGSGKTTLIQYILHSPDHQYKIAIIENEFAGLDNGDTNSNENVEQNSLAIESLIARDGTSNDNNTKSNLISLTELPNGCVCCTVKDSLVSTLEKLIEMKGDMLDYIIIEASGMANPGPIASIFWLDEDLDSKLRLDGIVTLVDAKHIEMQLRETGSSSSHTGSNMDVTSGFEAERQIAYADRILVNKIDLLPTQTDVELVIQLVSRINPTAPLKTTVFSKLSDLKWILDANCLDAERVQNIFSKEEVNDEDEAILCQVCCSDQDCSHNYPFLHPPPKFQSVNSLIQTPTHKHTSSVQTITLVYPQRSIDLKLMHTWLATILWPNQDKADAELRWVLEADSKESKRSSKNESKKTMRIFRMKGIMSVCHTNVGDLQSNGAVEQDEMQFIHPETGWDRRRYIVQAVHDLWEIHAGSQNLCWDSSSHKEDYGCKLVLIGQWLDRASIEEGFQSCLI